MSSPLRRILEVSELYPQGLQEVVEGSGRIVGHPEVSRFRGSFWVEGDSLATYKPYWAASISLENSASSLDVADRTPRPLSQATKKKFDPAPRDPR